MAKNDATAFALQYRTWCADRLTGLPNVKAFEFFSADQFLKPYSLSDDEILYGQIDAKHDGGVDSLYFFYNSGLVDDNAPIDSRAGGLVELKLFQSKQNEGFSSVAINKMERFLDDLLSLSRPESDYHYQYHYKAMRLIRIFKTKFLELCKRSDPVLSIECFYVSGQDKTPGRNAKAAARSLEASAKKYYSLTTVLPFNFAGVADLWRQYKIAPPKKKSIAVGRQFDTAEGWVGLTTLTEYFDFLKDKNQDQLKIDDEMFESNVRGYALNAPVNARIAKTLKCPDEKPEFWLLNNGITILSPKVTYGDGRLSIDNPRIVNGLQTSRRIFEYYSALKQVSAKDNRRIIIRVIQTSDDNARSEIIRATNDQNPMPAEALIPTLRIQSQLETYFEENGLFYDRRKGHYKAEKKLATQIISIISLMQAVIAILLRKPNYARGRPKDYLKDGKRQLIFGADDSDSGDSRMPFDLDVYLRCIQITRKIDAFLASFESNVALNIRFYMALDLTAGVIGNPHVCPPGDVLEIDVDSDFTDELMASSARRIKRLLRQVGGTQDDAAKSKEMLAAITRSIAVRLAGKAKAKRKARRESKKR